jgi:Putative prokaryotic signal transducing protein
MKEIFRHSDSARVGLYRSILEDAGIPCFVRNANTPEFLPDFFPSLCVLEDEDHPKALKILRNATKSQPTEAETWKCDSCGEAVPDNFDTCWNCETPRASGPVPIVP